MNFIFTLCNNLYKDFRCHELFNLFNKEVLFCFKYRYFKFIYNQEVEVTLKIICSSCSYLFECWIYFFESPVTLIKCKYVLNTMKNYIGQFGNVNLYASFMIYFTNIFNFYYYKTALITKAKQKDEKNYSTPKLILIGEVLTNCQYETQLKHLNLIYIYI